MKYQRHYVKMDRNTDFYENQVKDIGFKDWSIITLFHIALHYVDEYLSRVKGKHEMRSSGRIPPHSVRLNYVFNYLGSDFHTEFSKLFVLSKQARYGDTIEKQMSSQDMEIWENWVMTECKNLLYRTT